MLLRQSNVKLQEELRDTMKVYGHEKSTLRAHLANLRLDLSELHHDTRTVTTQETGSRQSISIGSETELKRLADFEGETHRSLQLPSVKNLAPPEVKSGGSTTKDSPNPSHREKETEQISKNLRFTSDEKRANQKENSGRSFLNNPNWENKAESQKFLELQRNQEVLRNIGRAQLKEKRQSLIRLPTITSAKKRNSLWDSGENVSRPKGKSTDFELHAYVEDAIVLNKKHFLIPSIKDPQRSEFILNGPTKRPALNKRKVQFTRPRQAAGVKGRDAVPDTTITTEANSLNTSMADVSLEDNTLGNITFDDDVFKHMMSKVQLDDNHKNVNDTKRGNDTLNTTLDDSHDDVTDDPKARDKPSKAAADNNNAHLPPLKVNYLAKRNLELHNNNMRVSPLRLYLPSISPETKSCKDSDRSVGTKLSLMSQQTELRKNMYLKDVDPARRNQTLSDIMFAVRSRMRENEEVIRFGQTPRPHDYGLDDYMLPKHAAGSVNANSSISSLTPRWSNANAGSPRKAKPTKKAPVYKSERHGNPKRKSSSTAEVQSFLKKIYRQRKTIDRMAGMDYKMAHFGGHRQLRMVAQQA